MGGNVISFDNPPCQTLAELPFRARTKASGEPIGRSVSVHSEDKREYVRMHSTGKRFYENLQVIFLPNANGMPDVAVWLRFF